MPKRQSRVCDGCGRKRSATSFDRPRRFMEPIPPQYHRCVMCRDWALEPTSDLGVGPMGSVERGHMFIIDYLRTHPCVDCGEDDIVVLEFDHVGPDKCGRVTSLAFVSISKATAEIAKCEVVCANCHTRRTARRAKWPRWVVQQRGRTLTLSHEQPASAAS